MTWFQRLEDLLRDARLQGRKIESRSPRSGLIEGWTAWKVIGDGWEFSPRDEHRLAAVQNVRPFTRQEASEFIGDQIMVDGDAVWIGVIESLKIDSVVVITDPTLRKDRHECEINFPALAGSYHFVRTSKPCGVVVESEPAGKSIPKWAQAMLKATGTLNHPEPAEFTRMPEAADDEQELVCTKCKRGYTLNYGCDPSPYCDPCAQLVVVELTAERDAWRTALIESGRHFGAALSEGVSLDFLKHVPEQARLRDLRWKNAEKLEWRHVEHIPGSNCSEWECRRCHRVYTAAACPTWCYCIPESVPSGVANESAGLETQIAKLAAFKAYVHKRLDDVGVPADPDSPHKAEGCRIGGRLDLVLAKYDRPVPSNAKTHRCKSCGRELGPGDVENIPGGYHGGDVCPCGAVENFEPLPKPPRPVVFDIFKVAQDAATRAAENVSVLVAPLSDELLLVPITIALWNAFGVSDWRQPVGPVTVVNIDAAEKSGQKL